MSLSWRGGSTRAWRELRARVLRRDGYRCRAHADGLCAQAGIPAHVCAGRASTAHHTLGRRVTGDDPRFIVAACRACNLAIGDPSRGTDPCPCPRTVW